MVKRGKRAQFRLSFGMIFSIILIAIFIAFAVYAVIKFVGTQRSVQISIFKKDLQEDVSETWRSSGDNSIKVEYFLPEHVLSVCFTDNDYENMYFISDENIEGGKIEHLDLASLSKDPYCVDNAKGKIEFVLSKDYSETLVRIE